MALAYQLLSYIERVRGRSKLVRVFKVNLKHQQRLPHEAILRLTEAACARASAETASELTGVGRVDAILRDYHVQSVEPVFRAASQASALSRLFRVLTESAEDLEGILAALRNHPDVEAIMPRSAAQTYR